MSARLTPDFLAEVKARFGPPWLPGLSAAELSAYESALGLRLPDDARLLLRTMNGRGDGVFYSYPRDLAKVRAVMGRWRSFWAAVREDLAADGTPLPPDAFAAPLCGHRGVLCSGDPSDARVLSIVEGDSILFADSLRAWLDADFPAR